MHFVQSGACWNCKANWDRWGVKPTACVDSSAQQWYSVGQCYDSQRKRVLVLEVNGQVEHKLWLNGVSSCGVLVWVFFFSVSIWGQQGGEQQWSNETNSVLLNYPIKSAFYLSAPTHPVQEQSHTHRYSLTHTHRFYPCIVLFLLPPIPLTHIHMHAIWRYCLCLRLCACEV